MLGAHVLHLATTACISIPNSPRFRSRYLSLRASDFNDNFDNIQADALVGLLSTICSADRKGILIIQQVNVPNKEEDLQLRMHTSIGFRYATGEESTFQRCLQIASNRSSSSLAGNTTKLTSSAKPALSAKATKSTGTKTSAVHTTEAACTAIAAAKASAKGSHATAELTTRSTTKAASPTSTSKYPSRTTKPASASSTCSTTSGRSIAVTGA